ncbi:6406_t:CDS:2 [Cetraspora pellucida]|uniref:6406_t:CDS:1 n=1 Tax=Cetraspora pellucida TaxID=1433469 RepID=A0A9N9CTG0_9GLOM|nr:6406_t:CDS:2 [Cetraspora pellucida]
MPPRCYNSSLKASNSNSLSKKRHTEVHKCYIENHIYNNRIISSFSVKVDKSATIWYFGTVPGLIKDTIIGKIIFESTIQCTQVADWVNTIMADANQDQFFRNGEVLVGDHKRDKTPKLA